MAKLPFVVAPKLQSKIVKIGNEEVGVVEIEKRGYLSVAEKSFVDSVMQSSDGVAGLVRIASVIGRKRKISTEKAYTLLIGVIDGSGKPSINAEISEEYGEEIAKIQSQMADSLQRKAIAATTILIQTRINADWTIEDTMELRLELLGEFAAFYDSEEAGISPDSEDKDKDPLEEAAEIVGK